LVRHIDLTNPNPRFSFQSLVVIFITTYFHFFDSNIGPTGLCLSSLGENQSFLAGKRIISRQSVPMSRAYHQTPARSVTAPEAPTSSSASSSYTAAERSRQNQSVTPRQPYMCSIPPLNPSSASAPGLQGHSTGASQYHDLTENRYNGSDSNTPHNTAASSHPSSGSDLINGLSSQEREIRYGNAAVGTDPTEEPLGSSTRQTNDGYAQQQHRYSLQQQHYQQQQLQLQQYEQNKQQSERYQYQQSNYWNTVMERTNGSSQPAHPVMTRDELAYQYRNISSSQSNRNFTAHTDSRNTHQAEGGPPFELTDGAASSSASSRAYSADDQSRQLQHCNSLSSTYPDHTPHQRAFIPNGSSTQIGGANGHCPSPQSKNFSRSNNDSGEKKRKREKLQYVNYVQKSAQTDLMRQKAAKDGSSDRYQDHSIRQIDVNDRDQLNRNGIFKDGSQAASTKDSLYDTNQHRQNQNGIAVTPSLPSSQSHVSNAVHHSAATIPGNRYAGRSSSSDLSDGFNSTHTNSGNRPQNSSVSSPQSDNGLAVLLLAISGTPSQTSTPLLSLPTLDLNSFASNMDKHFPVHHSDHKVSHALQSHTAGDGAAKLMNSPPQLLDPL
jgi:hypothetical protein